jgi:class 3 adenylate cyclase
MYRIIQRAMADAETRSDHILAVNLDVRGFSRFCKEVESLDAALFVKKAYTKILDCVFTDSDFHKLHGDGLIILYIYKEGQLKPMLNRVVELSVKAIDLFPTLFSKDPMLSFETPKNIGIGIARGPASQLYLGKKTLDYFGSPINLAARLSDMAEPKGVVIDAKTEAGLLRPRLRGKFSSDRVYVKGFAEADPLEILFLAGTTEIAPGYKRPLNEIIWETATLTRKFGELIVGPNHAIPLDHKPLDSSQIALKVIYPAYSNGERLKNKVVHRTGMEFEYSEFGNDRSITIDCGAIARILKADQIPEDTAIRFEVIYPT